MSDTPSWLGKLIKTKERNVLLICAGIAFVFWLTNALSESYSHDYSFSVDYQLQNNVSFASAPREKIEARITGQGWELLKASFKRGFRTLPVRVVRSEVTRSDLIAAIYEHLSDYEVVVREVNVDVLTLDVNMVISRSIPLVCDILAEASEGYVLTDSLHLEPAEVAVVGPASVIEALTALKVETVDLDALNTDLSLQLDVLQPENPYVSIEPSKVFLKASVDEEVIVTKIMEVTLVGDTSGILAFPNRVSVACNTTQGNQDDALLDQITVEADLTTLDSLTDRCQLRLVNVPEFVHLTRITPDFCNVSRSNTPDQ